MAAAPGMEKKDFITELESNMLSISFEKQEDYENKENRNYSRKEFSYKFFSRLFHLQKNVADANKIKAMYEMVYCIFQFSKKEEAKQNLPG